MVDPITCRLLLLPISAYFKAAVWRCERLLLLVAKLRCTATSFALSTIHKIVLLFPRNTSHFVIWRSCHLTAPYSFTEHNVFTKKKEKYKTSAHLEEAANSPEWTEKHACCIFPNTAQHYTSTK